MPMPQSVTRITRDGVEFTSNVDRAKYTLTELSRAALRDVGKFICISANKKAQKLYYNSMKKSKRVRTTRKCFQYWVRRRETDLQVGIMHDTWYGVAQELGTSGMKKKGILTNTTQDNIDMIVKIESQYLAFLEDEARALSAISEEEHRGDDEDE